MTEDETVEHVLAWIIERAKETATASFAESGLSDAEITEHVDQYYAAMVPEFRAKITMAIEAGGDDFDYTSWELH
jgi:hypothetical protein